jgi:hypothetical protein
MPNFCRNLSLIFAAVGFKMAPALAPLWIYQHVVWGGLWAFLFFLPLRGSYYVRGAFYSLPQTLIQLAIIFPKMGKGMWGLQLGYMAPVLVTGFGVIWGLATTFWLKFSRPGRYHPDVSPKPTFLVIARGDRNVWISSKNGKAPAGNPAGLVMDHLRSGCARWSGRGQFQRIVALCRY